MIKTKKLNVLNNQLFSRQILRKMDSKNFKKEKKKQYLFLFYCIETTKAHENSIRSLLKIHETSLENPRQLSLEIHETSPETKPLEKIHERFLLAPADEEEEKGYFSFLGIVGIPIQCSGGN